MRVSCDGSLHPIRYHAPAGAIVAENPHRSGRRFVHFDHYMFRMRPTMRETTIGLREALCVACAMIVIAAAPTANAQTDPTGLWRVARGVATIRIVDCDGRYWGVIAWEQVPGVDTKNPDPALRGRPTLGMPVLLGMTPRHANEWSGSIYNAENGRTYSAKISLAGPDTLQVKGCVMGVLCGGEQWTRVGPPAETTVAPSPKPAPSAPGARDSSQARAQASPQTQSAEDLCSGLVGPAGSPHQRGLK